MTEYAPRDLRDGDRFEIDGRRWRVREINQHPTLGYWQVDCYDDHPGYSPAFTFGDEDTLEVERSIENLTLDELRELVRPLFDQTNDCESCGVSEMPGVIAPCLPDGEDSHPFIERCDTCQRYPDDTAAALAIAPKIGMNVRRRFDDESLLSWRPFLARPGSPDDQDCYGIGGNEFGCFPDREEPTTMLKHFIAKYKGQLEDETSTGDLEDKAFLLVEKSRFDGAIWLTTFDTPDDASDYHDNQEYPEDWPVEALIDLRTGEAHVPVTTTTFTENA